MQLPNELTGFWHEVLPGKTKRWLFLGRWPFWFATEHRGKGINLMVGRQSQPPAGRSFPAPTGEQTLQERGLDGGPAVWTIFVAQPRHAEA